MSIYLVTVFYSHRDGRTVEAIAAVAAPDEMEAVLMAADAVRSFPHCVEVLGGICEGLPGGTSEAAAVAAAHAAAETRPDGATVH